MNFIVTQPTTMKAKDWTIRFAVKFM
jgi:hypothetical protein